MDFTLELGKLRYPAVFVGALLLGLYFTPIIRRGAIRYGVVDRPDGALKQHREPTPYLGGVAIYLAFLFALAFTYDFTKPVMGLLLSASIIVMIGLFDDLKVLTPGVKLIGQVVAAFVLIKAGVMIRLTFIPEWLALVLTVLWLVGVTNALNLIDVSDGLAAGVASIAGMFLYVVALWNHHTMIAMLTLALVGATLGFLAYNRPPAKIFLGDTGSMFLGFMLAALAMSGNYTGKHRFAAIAPVVILGVPIFDTLFVMGARAVRRIPLMRGSPDHFAVRMRNQGVRAGVIALLAYIVSAVLGIAGLTMTRLKLGPSIAIAAGVAVAAAVAVFLLHRIGRFPDERAQKDSPSEPVPEGSERQLEPR